MDQQWRILFYHILHKSRIMPSILFQYGNFRTVQNSTDLVNYVNFTRLSGLPIIKPGTQISRSYTAGAHKNHKIPPIQTYLYIFTFKEREYLHSCKIFEHFKSCWEVSQLVCVTLPTWKGINTEKNCFGIRSICLNFPENRTESFLRQKQVHLSGNAEVATLK